MEFTELVDELQGSTRLTDKSRVLWKYLHDGRHSDFHRYLFQEAFDSKKLHNVKLTKRDLPEPGDFTLEEVEEEVRSMFNLISGDHSSKTNKIRVAFVTVGLRRADQLALMGVVNKKLRCGVGISTINKVVTDLIPVEPIQLAGKYNPDKKYNEVHTLASDKLDGQRIFGIRKIGDWLLYSRDKDYLGREITTLDHWKPDLEKLFQNHGVNFTDGEAYKHGLTFEEISSLVSSSVNVKDTTELKYHLFMLGSGSLKAQDINFVLPEKVDIVLQAAKVNTLVAVKQEKILNTPDAIYAYLEEAVAEGHEGIMLRDIKQWYDYKRSDLLLKVKTSDTSGTEEKVDCYVIGIEYGDFAIREDGVESSEYLPVRLIVILLNTDDEIKMKVGSGFSLKQRREWKENEYAIVGQAIEVLCQGFGAKGKMRFPRLHRIREDL